MVTGLRSRVKVPLQVWVGEFCGFRISAFGGFRFYGIDDVEFKAWVLEVLPGD